MLHYVVPVSFTAVILVGVVAEMLGAQMCQCIIDQVQDPLFRLTSIRISLRKRALHACLFAYVNPLSTASRLGSLYSLPLLF
jgi:hypothetical protein